VSRAVSPSPVLDRPTRSQDTALAILPEPSAVSLPDLISACRTVWAARADLYEVAVGMDPAAADDARRKGNAIETYLAGREGTIDAQRAARALEAAVGAALGEPSHDPTPGQLLSADKSSSAVLRHEFRLMSRYRGEWDQTVDAAGGSRQAVLDLIHKSKTPRETAVRRMPEPLPELGGSGRYGLIYADPPWPMANWIESRDVTRHYPVKSIEELAAWPVADLAADDAVLYLWAISTHLHDALHVMEAWGFEYVAQMVWVKPSIGTGWWTRHQHELLLIGRRGEVSPPPPAVCPPSIIAAPKGRHSEKPDSVADMLKTFWPDAAAVELFGRKERPGWDVVGDEVAA